MSFPTVFLGLISIIVFEIPCYEACELGTICKVALFCRIDTAPNGRLHLYTGRLLYFDTELPSSAMKNSTVKEGLILIPSAQDTSLAKLPR